MYTYYSYLCLGRVDVVVLIILQVNAVNNLYKGFEDFPCICNDHNYF